MAMDSVSSASTQHPTGHHTIDRVAKAAHEVVDRAAARGALAEERLRRTGDRYGDQSRQAMDRVSSYIHDHPYTAVGLALTGGFVIGRLLRRR